MKTCQAFICRMTSIPIVVSMINNNASVLANSMPVPAMYI